MPPIAKPDDKESPPLNPSTEDKIIVYCDNPSCEEWMSVSKEAKKTAFFFYCDEDCAKYHDLILRQRPN